MDAGQVCLLDCPASFSINADRKCGCLLYTSIPGFDGTTATFGGPWGQGKGIAHDNSQVWMYDLVVFDSKKEVVFTGKDHSVYFGVLSHTGLHPFRMDLQTMTNSGCLLYTSRNR